MDSLFNQNIVLKDGRIVSFFLNKESGLVVVDVIHENETGGNTVTRFNAYEVDLSHCEKGENNNECK